VGWGGFTAIIINIKYIYFTWHCYNAIELLVATMKGGAMQRVSERLKERRASQRESKELNKQPRGTSHRFRL